MIGIRIHVLQFNGDEAGAQETLAQLAIGFNSSGRRGLADAPSGPFMKVPRVAKRDPPAKSVRRGTLKLKILGAIAMGRRRLRDNRATGAGFGGSNVLSPATTRIERSVAF